jgi:hypothetical protein
MDIVIETGLHFGFSTKWREVQQSNASGGKATGKAVSSWCLL